MKCASCGTEFERQVKFCPECGTPVQTASAAAPDAPVGEAGGFLPPEGPQAAQPARQAYIRADYDPLRDGRPVAGAAAHQAPPPQAPPQPQGYRGTPYQAPPVQAQVYQGAPYQAPPVQMPPVQLPQPQVQRPSSTGMIVFSVINILCCGFGISSILGIIALIFAIMSGSDPSWEESQKKLRTAKILNFIGLAFIIFSVIVSIAMFAAMIGSAGRWGREFFDPYFYSDYFNQ